MSIRKWRVLALRACFLPVVAVALFVRPSWPVGSRLAFWVEVSGYLLLLAGLLVRIWSIFYVGSRKSRELVTHGPYSLCRNPLYIGSFLLTIGAGLCFENLLMLVGGVCIVLPTHLVVVRMEEARLAELFGERYLAYKRRVPRYWPRLGGYESPAEVLVSVRAMRRIAIDTMGVLLLPEIEDFLEVLHREGVLPVLWHFP